MTFLTPQFRDLFGRRSGDQPQADESQHVDNESNRRCVRRMFLNEITDFLVSHDLSINATNFEFAREIVAGGNSPVNVHFRKILAIGDIITDDDIMNINRIANPHNINADTLHDMLNKFHNDVSKIIDVSSLSQKNISSLGLRIEDECSSGVGIDLVERLLKITRDMAHENQEIYNEMMLSNRNIKKLNSQLKKAKYIADHDKLTGLPNRRAFERQLQNAVVEARSKKYPLSLAFCDLDHFKNINDIHGHDTGDRVLCLVAALLKDVSRDRCHVTRHGGEEFVLLFPGRNVDEAASIVDEARMALGCRRLTNKETSQPLGQVTFSAGVANVMAFPTSSEALRAADEALYEAKSLDRNIVAIYMHAN